jgi:hypothetical protein
VWRTHELFQIAHDRFLVRQERVEFARAQHRSQRQLSLAVQSLTEVVGHADRLPDVRDAIRHDSVHAQRHLVRRHDLLPADVQHRLANVHRHELDRRDDLPERIPPRRQHRHDLATLKQDALLTRLNAQHVQLPIDSASSQSCWEHVALTDLSEPTRLWPVVINTLPVACG